MLTKVIEQSKIDHFTKWFDRADKIVIVSHVGPDGDAIGSFSGLVASLQLCRERRNYCAERLSRLLEMDAWSKDVLLYDRYKGVCRQADCRGGCHLLSDFNAIHRIDAMVTLFLHPRQENNDRPSSPSGGFLQDYHFIRRYLPLRNWFSA